MRTPNVRLRAATPLQTSRRPRPTFLINLTSSAEALRLLGCRRHATQLRLCGEARRHKRRGRSRFMRARCLMSSAMLASSEDGGVQGIPALALWAPAGTRPKWSECPAIMWGSQEPCTSISTSTNLEHNREESQNTEPKWAQKATPYLASKRELGEVEHHSSSLDPPAAALAAA